MKTTEFDYDLPAELIAQQPLADRAGSRMMVVDRAGGDIRHAMFRQLGQYLRPGDLLVLNDTRVIPARLWAEDPPVELLLVEKIGPGRWTALVKPLKKAKPGMTVAFAGGILRATVEGDTEFGGRILQFAGDLEAYLQKHGAMPLPPYIKRTGRDESDRQRYQTVYARHAGAIAAPTAGLHFTREVLAELEAAGIGHTFVTLHVGIGTFRPVKVEVAEEHQMHAEWYSVSEESAAAMKLARRIVAVGTTVVRALETLGEPRAGSGATSLFIYPSYRFRVVDALLTNFHLPRSTLLMMVSAFATRDLIRRAYAEAVRERYRFYSYGDCMLIE